MISQKNRLLSRFLLDFFQVLFFLIIYSLYLKMHLLLLLDLLLLYTVADCLIKSRLSIHVKLFTILRRYNFLFQAYHCCKERTNALLAAVANRNSLIDHCFLLVLKPLTLFIFRLRP